ncbi:MarR family winged helix-turn-helix transcriptional regulator [Gordonia hankookensis]
MAETPTQIRDSSPAPAGSVDAACDMLTGFLDRLACMGKAHTMDTLAATELTFSQLRVLFALGAHGDGVECMSVHEIADQVNLSLAAAGRTVDKLVGTGLVDRREDAADRRVKRVSLTTEGRQIVDSQLSIKQDLIRGFIGRLPEPLRRGLCGALNPIVDNEVDYFSGIGDPSPASDPAPPSDSSQKANS